MATSANTRFTGQYLIPAFNPEDALTIDVNLVPSVTLARGTIVGEVTATPGLFKAYATGNSDGSQVPKGILMYDCVTDASGNITFGTTAGAGGNFIGQGYTSLYAPIYISGAFKTADLIGLDAGAVAALFARFVSGAIGTVSAATTIIIF